MSRVYKDSDYEEPYTERILRIKPEGWVDSITFTYGHRNSCGQAEDGVYVSINNDAGGVMTLDDLVAMRDMVNDHLALVLYREASPDIDYLLPSEEEEKDKTRPEQDSSIDTCNCGDGSCLQ